MSNKTIIEDFKSQIISGGRMLLHSTKPDEFEFYAFSFELLNSDFSVDSIFHFPVNPNGISINNQNLVTLKKTSKGFSSQFNDSFVGKNISISGTFGRRFRLLLMRDSDEATTDLKIKTGYGATKAMESTIDKLYKLDKFQRPRFLVFHNHAFNQSFVVEVINHQFTQSLENNMMWNWSVEMKAVADAKKIDYGLNSKLELKKLLSESLIQSSINNILGNITVESTLNKLKDPLSIF